MAQSCGAHHILRCKHGDRAADSGEQGSVMGE